jgi:hypothetical protein
MAHHATESLADIHPRNLRMGCAHDHAAHLAHAQAQASSVIGPAIASAMAYSGITPKQVAIATGRPMTSVYRWLRGVENAPLDRLWTLGCDFQHGLIEALGRRCPGARVTTRIAFEKSRAS